ncbi:polysaccharide deacetylase family protein [Moorella naiadis]|uniref:polysaccharide deacetylase family protein n=1 Tax=Moorella naiadis (nom. illeg.) TaxID=3093670 RepID=UPI003D9C8502
MKRKAALVIALCLLLSLPFAFAQIASRFSRSPATSPIAASANIKPTATAQPAVATTPAAGTAQQASRPVNEIYYRDKVVVLIYHHIDAQEAPGLIISPERFASELDMLLARGYHVISLDQLRDFLNGGTVPTNAVLITFDDGYESVHQYALPELQKRQMPAVAFAIVKYVGQKMGNLQHYSWDGAREMTAAGITTQSHTYDLHNFAPLASGKNGPLLDGPLKGQSASDYRNMVYQDLKRSRDEIESQLHQPVYALALPFGAGGHIAIQAAVDAGFRLIFTTHYGVVTRGSNSLALPRVNAGGPNITPAKLDALIKATAGVTTTPHVQPIKPAAPHGGVVASGKKVKRI